MPAYEGADEVDPVRRADLGPELAGKARFITGIREQRSFGERRGRAGRRLRLRTDREQLLDWFQDRRLTERSEELIEHLDARLRFRAAERPLDNGTHMSRQHVRLVRRVDRGDLGPFRECVQRTA